MGIETVEVAANEPVKKAPVSTTTPKKASKPKKYNPYQSKKKPIGGKSL